MWNKKTYIKNVGSNDKLNVDLQYSGFNYMSS